MGVCWQRFSLAAVLTTSALTTNAPGLKLLLVGNTSVGQAHNFLDRRLCLQTIEDVLPLLYCIKWMRSERSAIKALYPESGIKASIRRIKSEAKWKLQLGWRRCSPPVRFTKKSAPAGTLEFQDSRAFLIRRRWSGSTVPPVLGQAQQSLLATNPLSSLTSQTDLMD